MINSSCNNSGSRDGCDARHGVLAESRVEQSAGVCGHLQRRGSVRADRVVVAPRAEVGPHPLQNEPQGVAVGVAVSLQEALVHGVVHHAHVEADDRVQHVERGQAVQLLSLLSTFLCIMIIIISLSL